MEQKFYICEKCGNIISMVKNSGVPVVCCGQKMTEIAPGAVEASLETSLPVYQVEGETVLGTMGAEAHAIQELKFYYCEDCDNLVIMLQESGVPMMCCGQPMKELVPGTVDASLEKHVPVVRVEGDQVLVTLGAEEHPMEQAHFIEWVVLQSRCVTQRRALQPGQPPRVAFALSPGDEVEEVYAYCNLHGLWKA